MATLYSPPEDEIAQAPPPRHRRLWWGWIVGGVVAVMLLLLAVQGFRTFIGTRAPAKPELSQSIVGGRLLGSLLTAAEHTLEFRAKTRDGATVTGTSLFTVGSAQPLVFFFTNRAHEIVAATQTGEHWNMVAIDRPGAFVGSSLSAVTDASGHIHLSYRAPRPQPFGSGQSIIMYATNRSGNWQTEKAFESEGRVGSTALAIGSDGTAHIIFNYFPPGVQNQNRVELRYATNVSGEWQVSVVATEGRSNAVISLDSQDRAHTVSARGGSIYYTVRQPDGSWREEKIGEYTVGRSPVVSLVIDSQNQPHITYAVMNPGQLRYIRRSGGAWTDEVIRTWASTTDQKMQMVLDRTDSPHIVLSDVELANPRSPQLFYFTRAGSGWATERISASNGGPGSAVTLRADESGNASVVFDDSFNGDLHFAQRTGGTWMAATPVVTADQARVFGGFAVFAQPWRGGVAPPSTAVTAKVASSTWVAAFLAAIDPANGLGYAVTDDAKPLPWPKLDRIYVRFEEAPADEVSANNFSLLGVNKASYTISSVSYDSNSRTATLVLAEPLGIDRLRLIITGLGRADAEVRFAVLPGDMNQDGTVAENDIQRLQASVGGRAGEARYDVLADLDGNGGVTVIDVGPLRANLGQSLPPG